MNRRVHFLCNGVYTSKVGGGDIHMIHLARAALARGYQVNFFGGHALQRQLENQLAGHTVTLTDRRALPSFDDSVVTGQFRMLFDYAKRLSGTTRQLSLIRPEDVAYAVGDFWYDTLPLVRCRAGGKMMVYHMQAPTFRQIAVRGRADVDATRLASLHYATSQHYSLRRFRRVPHKRLLHVHPTMREQLLRLGYQSNELRYVSFGVEPRRPSPGSAKTFDVIWIGRKHRQKGVEDLLQTLTTLKDRIPGFRAVLIGNLQRDLQPDIDRFDLGTAVEFAGFVSEDEKFRLLESSRVFLMPSRFEGSPRVIAEALVCEVPVVAYDVPTYRPLFGDMLRYVPCFAVSEFIRETEAQVNAARAGENYLRKLDLEAFRKTNSWTTVEETFCQALDELSGSAAQA
jgi:glycosyltransferase involved in cell wall biosynthesis